jgi:hypothetical protein
LAAINCCFGSDGFIGNGLAMVLLGDGFVRDGLYESVERGQYGNHSTAEAGSAYNWQIVCKK